MRFINHLIEPEIVELLVDYGVDDFVFNDKLLKEICTGDKNIDKELRMWVRICRQALLEDKLEQFVKNSPDPPDEELVSFYRTILPHDPEHRFFLFASDKHGTYVNLHHYGREEHIYYLAKLADCDEINLFYHATPFLRWPKDRNALMFKSIILDIDDPGFTFDPQTVDKETVRRFFIEKHNLPEDFPIGAILLSGHGAHVIIFTEEYGKEKFAIRQRIYDSLIATLSADVAVRNNARKYRAVRSFNIKGKTPIRTRLFVYESPEDDKSLDRLLPYIKPQDEIDEYFSRCKEATKAKTRNTIIQKYLDMGYTMEQIENKEYLKRKKTTSPKKTKTSPKPAPVCITEKPDASENIASFSYDKDYDLDFSRLRYRHSYKKGFSYWNVLLDIHNFLVRNSDKKRILLHKRNKFFHILTHIGRHVFETPESFIEYCSQYCGEGSNYFEEMCTTIYANYKGKIYPYRLETIAAFLDFSEDDIHNAVCSFTKEERQERRRTYDNEYYRTNRSDNKSARKKQECMMYIKDHPDADYKEITEKFDISTATFYRYKNEISAT